jgi:flagellin-like protein
VSVTLLLAQLRRVGVTLAALPLGAGLLIGSLGWVAAESWTLTRTSIMLTWLTQLFTLSVGVTAAVALTGDPLVEVHEATPVSFRVVQAARAGIVAAASAVGGVIMFTPLHLLGVWPRDVGWVTVVSPVGAAILLIAVTLAAAAFSGTPSTVTISAVAGWVFLALLWDPYVSPLAVQRGIPLAVSAVLVAAAWARLGDAERNIARVGVV